jgi:PAS domain S-box-containing protein
MIENIPTASHDVPALCRAADAARHAGDHAAALAHYGAALAALADRSPADPLAEYELRLSRAACYHAAGDNIAEAGELATMARLAASLSGPDLLALLASQATTALENARLYEELLRANRELERRVAERTADLEQRNAELAIINSVQQALASQLDLRAIFDLVGNKIGEIFNAHVVGIGIYDAAADRLTDVYAVERGARLRTWEPYAPFGFRRHILETRQLVLVNEDYARVAEQNGNPVIREGEAPCAVLFVPLIVGEQARGYITLQDLEREHAFTDSDVQLLSTLAAGVSVALENTRLFDESRRLLAETEQRAAELETVNRIGQALASELELDALIELTGEQIRQTFAADIAYVALHDSNSDLIQFPYYYEHGTPVADQTMPYGPGLTSRIIASGQPLLLNQRIEEFEAETGIQQVGTRAKSYLGVPIMSGQRAIGVVSVQSTQAEGHFGDDDVRLLTTIAANVGAAIQNARLFQETRQRGDEMAALAEIGRDVSATLDLPTVLERIATHAKDLLHGRDVVLRLLEPDGRMPVVVSLGKYAEVYRQWEVRLGYGLTGHVAQSGVAEIVNDPPGDPRVAHIPGTEADDPTEAMIQAPLLVGDKVIGIMSVWRDKTVDGPFNQADLDFGVGLARHAAIAIENARLFAEIRRQKQFSDALIEASPVAIIPEDLNEHVTSWNPAAERLFGYTRDEALGRHIDDLVANRPEIRRDADLYTRDTWDGKSVHAIARRTRKDGQLVDVELFGVSVIVDGQDVAGINLYHDITELVKARQEAIAANEAKSAFLANMSHELRTPLNAVLGFAQVMERDPALSARQREHLGIIVSSGEHLLNLINDVLEMSKIEAGQVSLSEAPFDLHGLLHSVEDLFRLRAETKQLRLRFELAPDLPRFVAGDESKLRQVLINLLGNAVKFTAAGQVTLRAAWDDEITERPGGEETGRQGDSLNSNLVVSSSPALLVSRSSLAVEVEDTGVGIAADQLPSLFQPFVQAASGAQAHEGTGLGLAITRQFVRLMGGEITATSQLGQGSLFRFDVRLTSIDQVQAPRLGERRVVGIAGEGVGYRMLVVDDKWENRRLMIEWLSAAGFEVREAADGEQAIAEWERWEPQLIWMDMRMPILDGYAATRRIKATLQGQATVIIALTASAFEHEQAIVLSAGCDDFVRKPVRESVVFEKITQHLGVQFVYDEPRARPDPAPDHPLAPALLASLPADWVASLRQAVLGADIEQVKLLCGQLQDRDRVLAERIERLAGNFQIDQLQLLVQ